MVWTSKHYKLMIVICEHLIFIKKSSSWIFLANLIYLYFIVFPFLRGFTALPLSRCALNMWNFTTNLYSISKIIAPILFNLMDWLKIITYDLIIAMNHDNSVGSVSGLHNRWNLTLPFPGIRKIYILPFSEASRPVLGSTQALYPTCTGNPSPGVRVAWT
jgi:hypothetical protein